MGWYDALRKRQGRGTRMRRASSLADLHVVRAAHQGQFFTPDSVARLMWDLLAPAMATALDRRIRLFDNSVGTGRLFQFADPHRHILSGVDIDAGVIAALAKVTEAAGFIRDFELASMSEIHPTSGGFDIGLINPPYSLTLQSPHLMPYPCTTWGVYGPNTSALSHAYALHQALDACQIVGAILFRSYARSLLKDDSVRGRLVALLHLPAGAFESANARIDASIAIFDRACAPERPVIEQRLIPGARVPVLPLKLAPHRSVSAQLGVQTIEDNGPSIHLPVTGDARVRLAHDGRRLQLKFFCGLMQAKVLNTILKGPLPRDPTRQHRYPPGLCYRGELAFDLEVHLLQADPRASIEELLELIRECGAQPEVASQLWHYLERRRRELQRACTPFRRWVRQDDVQWAARLIVRPKRLMPVCPERWGSPILDPAQALELRAAPGDAPGLFELRLGDHVYPLSTHDVQDRFVIVREPSQPVANGEGGADTWRQLFPGKAECFPQIAAALAGEAKAQRLERWLAWDYQLADLIEAAINPRGAIIAWEPGMGKARLALALAMLFRCRRALIVLEAGLVGEFKRELALLEVDPTLWQVLTHPAQLMALRRVNVISYERLRSPVCTGAGRRTWARMLRRRVGIVICDEADHLSNLTTAQSRAVTMLCAKRRYALSGTPMGNYPRDLLPLMAWAIGDGTAAQPYGYRRAYLEARLLRGADWVQRGIDVFRERFIKTEWVTKEFTDQLQSGAKREVPKIQNLPLFRQLHAPHVLRRQTGEPECARYLPIPVPTQSVTTVEWDDAHLAHYLEVAEDFATWYQQYVQATKQAGRPLNTVQVLARIQAVIFAANQPHDVRATPWRYDPLTSKQRYVIGRLVALADEGHKTILYARSPALLQRLECELAIRGVQAVRFDGTLSPATRMRQLDARFRFGPASTLLASYGVTQKGLNIPQADRALFYAREWTARSENQAARRLLRPQQSRPVHFEYTHLRGSIDEYMAQMVAFKQDAADAGLDWQAAQYEDIDFVHLDTLLSRFCKDLAALRGLACHELRDALKATG